MTTIATDGKSMAGDGQSEVERTVFCTARQKIKRLKDGSLFGAAGRSVDTMAVANWLNEGGKKPKIQALSALRLMPDGKILYYNELLEPTVVDSPCATGSGMDFAIGAMEAGASPEKAVEIAARRDTGTGGKITVLRIKQTLEAVA